MMQIYTGDMDTYYLDKAVVQFEDAQRQLSEAAA